MNLHDAYGRVTPAEIAFGGRDALTAFAAAVDAECEDSELDPVEVDDFAGVTAVEAFVRKAYDGPPTGPAAHSYALLAFHAYHLARADFQNYLLAVPVVRFLVDEAQRGEPSPPHRSGYVQLPRHLVWEESGAGPSSVDGIYWSLTPRGVLHALVVAAVRPEAGQILALPLPVAPIEDANRWLTLEARPDGPDFASRLPGAELDQLYSLTTAGEALKLLARVFVLLSERETSMTPAPVDSKARAEGDPPPSSLPFARIIVKE